MVLVTKSNNIEHSAFYDISYGLYLITCFDGKKHNGFISNTLFQITSSPERIAIAINKQNYSFQIIKQSGIMNINCLDINTPFVLFKNFGFKSGKNTDKFADYKYFCSDNGLAYTKEYTNSYLSLKTEQYIDVDTHGIFICKVTDAKKLSNRESITYAYYQKNLKPQNTAKSGKYVCKICGYVYESDTLPNDFICPICKHGVTDFEKVK